MRIPQWLKCNFGMHDHQLKIKSSYFVFEKGNREIVVFDGMLKVCECTDQLFVGSLLPWFKGSWEQLILRTGITERGA